MVVIKCYSPVTKCQLLSVVLPINLIHCKDCQLLITSYYHQLFQLFPVTITSYSSYFQLLIASYSSYFQLLIASYSSYFQLLIASYSSYFQLLIASYSSYFQLLIASYSSYFQLLSPVIPVISSYYHQLFQLLITY